MSFCKLCFVFILIYSDVSSAQNREQADPCVIPEIPFGYAKHNIDKIEYEAEDGTTISVECYDGYTTSEQITTTCKNGEWDHQLFPKCKPNPCNLTLQEGMSFWANLRLLTGKSGTKHTFDTGTKLKMRCDKSYRMKDMISQKLVKKRITYSTCNLGNWTHQYECIPEECSVPKVFHARLRDKAASQYKHSEKITFICDDGFNFDQNVSTKVTRFETTCNLGNWADDIPQECKKDGCRLDIHEGSYYYVANTNESITSGKLIEHLANIQLQCMDTYDLFNDKNEIFLDKEFKPTVTCYQGNWQNAYICKKRCVLYNLTNGRLMKDTVNPQAGETIKHGESIKVECDDESYDSNLSIECDGGTWQPEIDCSVVSSSSTTIKSTVTTTESVVDPPTESEYGYDYDYLYESQSADTLPVDSQCHSKGNKGCTLSKDRRYMYEDSSGKKIKPGSIICDDTTLHVTCTIIDLDEYLNSYYNDEYNTDLESYPTITCANNTLSPLELDCPEVETCLELQHGNVTMKNGYFMVLCDKGYSLNLTIPEDPRCTCKHGTLKSVYGDQIPHCIPDNCTIPYEFDGRLSVTYRNAVSLSGGSVVAVGEFVYFNCSKADGPTYEPFNRRFSCSNGLWTEAERDGNWRLGYNGEFPRCRAAICEPNCTNGGVCYKDDTCRCKHLTEGKRCENVICDNKCSVNGGKCVGPGKCGDCPQGKFGKNCEKDNCRIPYDFDWRLSVTYMNSVSLAGGSVVAVGEFVYLNCSKADGPNYEPWNRRFTCSNGLWTEAERDGNWKLGYNGKFPECRAAICEPNCTNGGVCYKDDTCRCKHLTEGKRCENVICDEKCNVNGGKCIGPGKCQCPQGKSGKNCEQGIDQQRCIASFDSGHSWWPRWSSIRGKDKQYLKYRRGMSLIGCKQACINLQTMTCVAVSYDNHHKTCWTLAVSDRKYFIVKYGRWNSPVYLRTCKHFD